MQLLLGKTILSGPPEDLPTFRVTQQMQAGRRVKPYANQPAVTAIMQDYALYNYSHARRPVRSTLNSHPEPSKFRDGCSWRRVVPTLTLPRLSPHLPSFLEDSLFRQKIEKKAKQKKSKKTSDPKTTFFTQFSGFPSFLFPIFINFGLILGLPGGCFLTFSAGQISNRFFHRFLKKNMLFSRFRRFRKNTDPMQGSLQNAWFWQGGKMRGRLGKTIDFSSQISSKIDEKSSKKSR